MLVLITVGFGWKMIAQKNGITPMEVDFFINAVDVLSANIGAFNSTDGVRVAFGLGFGF